MLGWYGILLFAILGCIYTAYIAWITALGISLLEWPCKYGSPWKRECTAETNGRYLQSDLQAPDKGLVLCYNVTVIIIFAVLGGSANKTLWESTATKDRCSLLKRKEMWAWEGNFGSTTRYHFLRECWYFCVKECQPFLAVSKVINIVAFCIPDTLAFCYMVLINILKLFTTWSVKMTNCGEAGYVVMSYLRNSFSKACTLWKEH